MPLLETTSAFANILGLVSIFRNERSEQEAHSYEDFLAWLRTHRHDQIVDLLINNELATHSVQGMLTEQYASIMQAFATINSAIVDVASRLPATSSLASALSVTSELSEQSLRILAQLVQKKASKFLELRTRGGTHFLVQNGAEGELEILEHNFVDDDLETLCDRNLLRLSISSKGTRNFQLTRIGAAIGAECQELLVSPSGPRTG